MDVKIKLKKGQTPEQAEEALYKALNSQRTGEIHGEEFSDPVMEAMAKKIIEAHKRVWAESLDEIMKILDEEYE